MTKTGNLKLNILKAGESGVIEAIHADESLYHRLTALGFRIGKRIELIRHASFNGPLHIRIGSTDVMMRQSEAARIHISQEFFS